MTRRGSPQVVGLVAVAVLFIYGFYEYHEVKSALRRTEELVRRAKVEKDNLSTQLQGALEQKLRLEASIAKERDSFKKSKDELSKAEIDCSEAKATLNSKFRQMADEAKQMKVNYESLQSELERHRDGDTRHEEERLKLDAENRRLKQEGANDIAGLRDEIANLKRQNKALQKSVSATGQQQKVAVPIDTSHVDNNRIPQMAQDHQQLPVQDSGRAEKGDFDIPMQINKPGNNERLPYFEPKQARPDHPLLKRDANSGGVNKPNIEGQVAPPDVNNNANEVAERQVDQLRRGAKQHPLHATGEHQDNPALGEKFGDTGGRFGNQDFGRVPRAVEDAPQEMGKVQREKFGRRFGRVEGPVDHDAGQADAQQGQVVKPLQIAEPHLQHEEENQLQGPHHDQNGEDKDDDGNNADDNEEEYQYDDKDKLDKAAGPDRDKVVNDGPHAAPVDEDDLAGKDDRMR